jgi:hypothetical protein
MYKIACCLLLSILLLSSCYDDGESLWLEERVQIRTYLQDQGITEYIEDSTAGYFYYLLAPQDTTLDWPDMSEEVELNFRMTLLDGTELYSTYTNAETDTIKMSDAITGWQLALQNFYVGDQFVLILPSRLAYGKDGLDGLVPPDSPLIFEVDLVEIHPHF